MADSINLDTFFGVDTADGWVGKLTALCSVAKYTSVPLYLRGSRKIGERVSCDTLAKAVKRDLDALRTKNPNAKLPFLVFDALVRQAFSEWNVRTLRTFLRVRPTATLQAPLLYEHIVSQLTSGDDYDPTRISASALGKLLQGWRQTMEMTEDKTFAVANLLAQEREARRKQQVKEREAARKEQAEEDRRRDAAREKADAAAGAAGSAPVGGAAGSVVQPQVTPVVQLVAPGVAAPADKDHVVATGAKRKRGTAKPKKPKKNNYVRAKVVLKKRRNKLKPKSNAADAAGGAPSTPLMTI